jgi:hypothetical protein
LRKVELKARLKKGCSISVGRDSLLVLNREGKIMAWIDIARRGHNRDSARYPSDLRDQEWSRIAPLPPPAKRGGRPRTTCLRAVSNAIVYVGSSGCQWRALPKCFPPVSTVRNYFDACAMRASSPRSTSFW